MFVQTTNVQTFIWPSWCHCHSLSLASVKFRLVLPFSYRLTWVVPEKGPLNGCVCVFVQMTMKCCITSSTSMVHLHLTILRHIQTQTTAVSLLQLITGKWYDVTTNIVLYVSPTMTRCQVLCKLWQPIYISLCVHTFTSVSCKLTSLDLSVCQTYNIQHGPIKAVPHFVISCLLKKRCAEKYVILKLIILTQDGIRFVLNVKWLFVRFTFFVTVPQ